jgi:uncharacterized protein YcbX
MAVSSYPHMTQFLQEISPSSSSTSKLHDSDGDAKLTIRYLACGDASKQSSLTIPLTPSTKNLQTLEVNMHGSATLAHRMPDHYNAWFTSCFGFAVELVYLGSHRRSPRFSDMMSSSSSSSSPSPPSPIPSPLAHLKSLLPTPTSPLTSQALTFADCAPYLFCTTASLDSVSQRLQLPSTALAPASAAATATKPMDITKFRPNIVLAGAQQAWHEDYWASLRIFSSSGQKKMDNTTTNQTNVSLVHNCVRCKSINIDYATGKPGAGPTGEVLKRLQADRRVDVGARWSPVFGRYGFWEGSGKGKGKGKGKDDNGEEVVWSVGDKVRVTRVNKERTVWSKFSCLFFSSVLHFLIKAYCF